MKHIILFALLLTVPSLSSCTLAGRLIQAPVRLMQAGVRTVTDVNEQVPPATAESLRSHGLALKHSEAARLSRSLPQDPTAAFRGQIQVEPQRPRRE